MHPDIFSPGQFTSIRFITPGQFIISQTRTISLRQLQTRTNPSRLYPCQGFLKEIGVTILIRIECRSDLYWVYSLADPGWGALLVANLWIFLLIPPPPVDKVHALPKIKSGIRHWVDHIFNFFTPSPAAPIEKCTVRPRKVDFLFLRHRLIRF